jgi:Mg2+ and Co2+ transporter CorA
MICIFILVSNISYASFQEVRIGKIDDYYVNKISYEQLRDLIDEIEEILENQLDMNIFDYSEQGKPIDIVYVPASKLEKTITRKIEKLQGKKSKILKYQNSFTQKQKKIDNLKTNLIYENKMVNNKLMVYNNYIKKQNQKKISSNEELNRIKKDIKDKKVQLDTVINKFKKEQRYLKNSSLVTIIVFTHIIILSENIEC